MDRDEVARALADVTDTRGAAEILGVAHSTTVHLYRQRHADFPAPVLDLGAGRCQLWLRTELEAWRRDHPPRRR